MIYLEIDWPVVYHPAANGRRPSFLLLKSPPFFLQPTHYSSNASVSRSFYPPSRTFYSLVNVRSDWIGYIALICPDSFCPIYRHIEHMNWILLERTISCNGQTRDRKLYDKNVTKYVKLNFIRNDRKSTKYPKADNIIVNIFYIIHQSKFRSDQRIRNIDPITSPQSQKSVLTTTLSNYNRSFFISYISTKYSHMLL